MVLTESLRRILAPAVGIARTPFVPSHQAGLQPVLPFPKEDQKVILSLPNERTYYLGQNGRVSQRRQLVGEVLATIRATSTPEAVNLFRELERRGHEGFLNAHIGRAQ